LGPYRCRTTISPQTSRQTVDLNDEIGSGIDEVNPRNRSILISDDDLSHRNGQIEPPVQLEESDLETTIRWWRLLVQGEDPAKHRRSLPAPSAQILQTPLEPAILGLPSPASTFISKLDIVGVGNVSDIDQRPVDGSDR
jgi:hypothetical protein